MGTRLSRDHTAGQWLRVLSGQPRSTGRSGGDRPPRHQQAEALLTLAQQVQAVLVQQEPRSDFRRRLHSRLVASAEERRPPPPPNRMFTGILLAAAALGSLAGVIVALLVRSRHGRAEHIASTTG